MIYNVSWESMILPLNKNIDQFPLFQIKGYDGLFRKI